MIRWLAFLFSAILIFLQGCNSCVDCVPITSNPSIKVNYRNIENERNRSVYLSVLNGTPTKDILLIQDDTIANTFNLPINLNEDSTIFIMKYFLESDTLLLDPLEDTLVMSYEKITNINERRRVTLAIDNIELLSSTFDRDTLICNNVENCTGDGHTVRVFF
jgi:hypothetical protein